MVKPATSICGGRRRNKDHGIGVEGKGIHALGNCLLGTMRGVKKRMCNPCGKAALAPILVSAHDARGHAFKHTCRKTAVRAYNLLGCDGLSRVDFFVTEKEHKVILNEINTLPGFTSISMYPKLWENAGTPYSELLEKLIDCAFTRED